MRLIKSAFVGLCATLFTTALLPAYVSAQKLPDVKTYAPSWSQMESRKKMFDDPRPFVKEWPMSKLLPKEIYSKIVFDEKKMKEAWSELVGFKAPDVVGKIAPDIKPGKYTYKDVQQNPGFKQLMFPDLYGRIKPGAAPYIGNIPEFEIIPTRQFYWSLPISEATKKNLGKTKLDAKGYLVWQTWDTGYAFPKPSGPQKAQQIMANLEHRYLDFGGETWLANEPFGVNARGQVDYTGKTQVYRMGLWGRSIFPPYGVYDSRAKENGEYGAALITWDAPRDQAGQLMGQVYYMDPLKSNMTLLYLPAFRRVRKMSATDTQDAIGGQDIIFDDQEGWQQKLSPEKYPYKYEVIDEREYLVMAPTVDGAEYYSSKNFYELKNVRMERRPCYIVQLTQLDKNYVYGRRLLVIDKETFLWYHVSNFDQRGRLYRTYDMNYGFHPEMGQWSWHGAILTVKDHIDQHSGGSQAWALPAAITRDQVRLEGAKGTK